MGGGGREGNVRAPINCGASKKTRPNVKKKDMAPAYLEGSNSCPMSPFRLVGNTEALNAQLEGESII